MTRKTPGERRGRRQQTLYENVVNGIGEFTVIIEGKKDLHFFPIVPTDLHDLADIVVSDVKVTYVDDASEPVL